METSDANISFTEVYPDCVITAGAKDNVDGCTNPIKDGEAFDLNDGLLKVHCHHTPFHTRGHMIYYFEAGPYCHDNTQIKIET